MATLREIDSLTEGYAAAREALAGTIGALQDDVREAQKKYLGRIKRLVATAAERQAALHAAIDASPGLFVKPKTLTLHGVKVGFQKAKDKVVIADEQDTIARIHALLPKDQAELLTRKTESVHLPAVADLSPEDLKRLHIEVQEGQDAVLIKDAAGDVDKLVAALLKEGVQEGEA